MDKHGYLSLYLSMVMEKDCVENADVVILEASSHFSVLLVTLMYIYPRLIIL